MKKFLIGLFAVILPSMMAISFIASLERSVFQAGRGLWLDRWFRATLLDACFGFIIFLRLGGLQGKIHSLPNRVVHFDHGLEECGRSLFCPPPIEKIADHRAMGKVIAA